MQKSVIEEEISHLRHLLSLLKLEEESLRLGKIEGAQTFFTEISAANKKKTTLKRGRKEFLKTFASSLPIEIQSLLDQIKALEKTIRLQTKSNIELRKQPPVKSIDLETLKKKKWLLLEEEA